MVEYLARACRDAGLRVVLISRGYGQAGGLNDEGLVLEDNLPDVPHLQGRDRVALARTAEEELASQIAVLDDGFQHRRLARDLDIVLLDALDPFGMGRIFPRGLLREPVRSLRRAGLAVLSRADLVDAGTRAAIRGRAERAAGPLAWVECRQAPRDLIDTQGTAGAPASLSGTRVAAFCGIGNPEGFRRTLEVLGARIDSFRAYPDHHIYSASDVADLAGWARERGADLALTTQKDYVKLRADALGGVPLRALRIGVELLSGGDALASALRPLIAAARARPDPLA
jgi:tetraacyldisaccharide 4'-kinase